jgi:hypothetical protein
MLPDVLPCAAAGMNKLKLPLAATGIVLPETE